ncbi:MULTISPECIES: hypothetical protein [Paenibacillus]|uniref:hypothetical protein n=1 Tax=Paenibacillus TaxID=44249 RepID=UPI0022B8D08C|nr:hypothetical protein [Paenibacillus caseinilyticus]MCZ8519683.1 hypothetical protein [Paenibacillus caseinilyticus]
MNRWSMTLVISTLALGLTGAAWMAGPQEQAAETAAAPAVQAVSVELAAAQEVGAETQAVQGTEVPAAVPVVAPAWKLQRVNGLSVDDDLKTLYEIKGEPAAVEKDPLFKDEQIFVYPDCRVGLYQNFIQYVMVPADSGMIEIDGQRLELSADSLKAALGEPDWTAEDGLVYRRGQAALKLFISADTGLLTSVHYFHSSQS